MRPHALLIGVLATLTALSTRAQYNPPNATPPVPPAPTLTLRPGTNTTNSEPATSSSATTTTAPTNSTPPTTEPATSTAAPPVKNVLMPPSMDKIDDKRALIPGDVINYRVVEDHDQPRSLPLNESGEIEVPLLGRVSAAGKTLKKLAEEIKTLLEKDYYYQATVLLSMDSTARVRAKVGKIYVVGQIRTPGAQDIPEDEVYTVSKAILRAGGFADFADKRKVKLVRKKALDTNETDTIVVDTTEVFDKGNTRNDPVVKPDDLIIIPQRLINF